MPLNGQKCGSAMRRSAVLLQVYPEAKVQTPFFPEKNGASILYPVPCNRRTALMLDCGDDLFRAQEVDWVKAVGGGFGGGEGLFGFVLST